MSLTSVMALTNIARQFNQAVPILIVIFGLPGNIFNIIIFTRRSLRKNPCTTYFFSSSIVNLSGLFFGVTLRCISDGFGIDLVSSNLILCRIRYLILHCSMVLSSWFIVLAGIDRYCISSRDVRRRHFSTLKHARLLVALTISVCFVLYCHVLGLFDIEQLTTGPYCYARAGAYRVFYDFLFFATYSFTPPLLMVITGCATLSNIRGARGRIEPATPATGTAIPNNVTQLRKRDRQLITMLLVQFISIVILTLPIAIQKLYATFTQNFTKSSYQVALESLITQVTRQVAFINFSTSFYVYTLSAAAFRQEFAQIVGNIIAFVFGVNSSLHRRFQQMAGNNSTMQSMAVDRTMVTQKRRMSIQMDKIGS